jgi:hypothetical protein
MYKARMCNNAATGRDIYTLETRIITNNRGISGALSCGSEPCIKGLASNIGLRIANF